jgi:hypothetical protein
MTRVCHSCHAIHHLLAHSQDRYLLGDDVLALDPLRCGGTELESPRGSQGRMPAKPTVSRDHPHRALSALPPLPYFLHLCRTVDSTSRLLESLVVMSRLNRSIFVRGVARATRRLVGIRHPRRHGRLSQSRPADFANGFEGRAPGVNGTPHVLVPPLIGTPRAMLDEEIRAFD